MACRECEKKRKELLNRLNGERREPIYMDYAATAPVRREVQAAWLENSRLFWGNPSSLHPRGLQAWEAWFLDQRELEELLDDSRENWRLHSSGCRALAFALAPALSRGWRILTTSTEHSGLREPLEGYQRSGGTVHFLEVNSQGEMDQTALEEHLRRPGSPWMLAYSPVNHETGALQKCETLYQKVKAAGGMVLMDSVQALARLPLTAWRPYCDGYVISGHKIGTPRGIAFSSWPGGGAPEHEPRGSENTPGWAALTRGIKLHLSELNQELDRLTQLSEEGLSIMDDAGLDFKINSPERGAPGMINISLSTADDMEQLMKELGNQGFCLSRFSACTGSFKGPSPILRAMGVPAPLAERSLRISLGRHSRRDDFFRLARALKQLLPSG